MVDWTFDAVEVGWMTERLAKFWDRRLAAIAPTGFPAYGRIFHPAQAADGTWVRWSTVADHNGVPMTATSDFFHLALPASVPTVGTVWTGDPPQIGTLERHQAEHLIDVLVSHTSTPNAVTFALWDGLGWDHAALVRPGMPPALVPDPIPPSVRRGPRMRIPGRDYIVYTGAIGDALRWMRKHQTPHFWWPRDHAWVVAGDVDLPWSIVAGSPELIDRLVQDTVLEVMRISAADVLDSEPEWLTRAVSQAVQDLISDHAAVIATSCGTVSLCLSNRGNEWWLVSGMGSMTRLSPDHPNRSLKEQLSSEVLTALIAQLGLY